VHNREKFRATRSEDITCRIDRKKVNTSALEIDHSRKIQCIVKMKELGKKKTSHRKKV